MHCFCGERSYHKMMANKNTPSQDNLRKILSKEQYEVTQECATEPPFQNKYWNHHEPGIYVDVVDGTPLFSSLDKFDSGSGWPSFTKPIDESTVAYNEDRSYGMIRTEVKSASAQSHLGHLFDDGPGPLHKRFCMNSASLRFVHAKDLEKEGYGEYLALFPAFQQSGAFPQMPGKDETQTMAAEEGVVTETAIFAGGCFWGVQELLRTIPGVIETSVGYTGGILPNPTYRDVSSGTTGHAEAVRIVFDPKKVSYQTLLEKFFSLHDPTTPNRQGNDIGNQYRSAIFYQHEQQKAQAEKTIKEWDLLGRWKRPIVTEVVKAGPFYVAEEFHQDYLQKHPEGYTCHYYRSF